MNYRIILLCTLTYCSIISAGNGSSSSQIGLRAQVEMCLKSNSNLLASDHVDYIFDEDGFPEQYAQPDTIINTTPVELKPYSIAIINTTFDILENKATIYYAFKISSATHTVNSSTLCETIACYGKPKEIPVGNPDTILIKLAVLKLTQKMLNADNKERE